MTEKTGIIGCGRAGTHLAFHLKQKNWPLCGLWDRDPEKARQTSSLTGLPILEPEALSLQADILVLALPDDALEPFCADLARRDLFRRGQTVFHLSGSQSSALLAPAAAKGALTASLHPLQSFAAQLDRAHPFQNILMTAEGMPQAVTTGLAMAECLGARGLRIAPEAKTLYHAAAVVASNYLVTLMDFALDLLGASGVKEDEGLAFLSPLISGTLANLQKLPPAAALTGPITRGDSDTLSRHLCAIAEKRPDRERLYRELGKATLDLAQRGNHPDPVSGKRIASLLSGPKVG